MISPLLAFCTMWFGASLIGTLMVIYDGYDGFKQNLRETPWTIFGLTLILLAAGVFTLGAALATLFYIPFIQRSNERAVKAAKEHAKALKAKERWVQLELFEEDE